jgi:hypothetical protein
MKTNELSFVVQGAVEQGVSSLTGKPITQSCLQSLRRHYPGAEVILSTWTGQLIDGLDFDKLILNEDPGACNVLQPGGSGIKLDNTNRQIVSSRSGLRAATRKYAAKVRSDMIFSGNEWMSHCDRYPARGSEWRIFRERVITCSMWARDPKCPYSDQPLHPPDWIHIGLREDIQLLWDIDLQPEPESSQWFLNRKVKLPPPIGDDIRRFSPEQYLWRTLLKKFGEVHFEERGDNSAENIWLTEVSFANNLIILDLPQFPFMVEKYRYVPSPQYRYYQFITHKEWKRLYYQYSAGQRLAAGVYAIVDPEFYIKRAYQKTFRPLQVARKLAALTTGRVTQS